MLPSLSSLRLNQKHPSSKTETTNKRGRDEGERREEEWPLPKTNIVEPIVSEYDATTIVSEYDATTGWNQEFILDLHRFEQDLWFSYDDDYELPHSLNENEKSFKDMERAQNNAHGQTHNPATRKRYAIVRRYVL